MVVGDPWDAYTGDKPPRPLVYPLGQERITDAVTKAGASVRSLSLHAPKPPPDPATSPVFDVAWFSDARPGYLRPGLVGAGPRLARTRVTEQALRAWDLGFRQVLTGIVNWESPA